MFELLQYEFMRNAITAALLASISCGIIGVYVVVKRLVFISGGITHAAFGGIGLGYLLGINPVVAVTPFSLLIAIMVGILRKKTRVYEDTAIGIFWTSGMALGIIFIGLSKGYTPDLFSYLFGNILAVPKSDLLIMAVLNIIIVLTVVILYKAFLAITFDEEYAETKGLPVLLLYIILLCLIALTVVVLIRIVGIILVMALLTIPAAISKQFVSKISKMMVLSVILGMVFTCSGLVISYYLDLASGATIIIVSSIAYFLSTLINSEKNRKNT